MRRTLTREEFGTYLRDFKRSAFRLEIQPSYLPLAELDLIEQFNSGTPGDPMDAPGVAAWLSQVEKQVREEGKRLERVRIRDEPETPYQSYLRWIDAWNLKAGERIRYITRQQAYDIGLLPAAGDQDWWLLDERALLVMTFGDDHAVIKRELVTDPEEVAQAVEWRDLTTHHSVPAEPRDTAA